MKKTKIQRAYSASRASDSWAEPYLSMVKEFDEEGHETLEIKYFDDGSVESKLVWEYDAQGKKTREQSYLEGEELAEDHRFEYGPDGKLQAIEIHYGDGSSSRKTYERQPGRTTVLTHDDEGELEEKEVVWHEADGLVLKRERYSFAGTLEHREENSFDAARRLVRRLESGAGGAFESDLRFAYDDRGRLLQRVRYTQRGTVIDKVSFAYDDKDRVVENRVGSTYWLKFTYDDENHTETQERYRGNALEEHNLVRYSPEGLMLEEQTLERQTRFEYEFYDQTA